MNNVVLHTKKFILYAKISYLISANYRIRKENKYDAVQFRRIEDAQSSATCPFSRS